MKPSLLFSVAANVVMGVIAVAQTTPTTGQPAPPAKTSTGAAKPPVRQPSEVDQVIQLTKAGMSESLIIKFLQKDGKTLTLTAADLLKLKQGGVSEKVMAVMIDPTSNPAAAVPPAAEAIAPPPVPPPVAEPVSPPPASAPVAAPATVGSRSGPSTGNWRSDIQRRIESDYPITQATGDKSDIVSAGAVIILKKNSLVLHSGGILSNANTYKNGRLSAGFLGGLCKNSSEAGCRTFVKGEKFWLTDVEVREDSLTLQFLSDPLPDSRYSGTLKFPFPKGTQPTVEQMAALVAEVIQVDTSTPPPAAASASAPIPAPQQTLAPIAPPPPPDQAPPQTSISVGQTKDQVIAALGQPLRVATVGTKQILYFSGLKVTLVNNKVTAVQ
ncbi:MAG TPA: hypothetical protein VME17_15750 [Bryobacteraceae bacterium]|nr:hypothetical protein [Bryobacteraceae bacterium]